MHLVTAALPLVLSALLAAPRPSEPVHKLYVANSAGNDIHVIDTDTNRVIRRVDVGPEPHKHALLARR
jgi:YVTN family beta-propeller protein